MENEKKKSLLTKIIAFSTAGILLLIYMVNFTAVSEFFSYINGILMPLFIGVVLAYLMTPIVDFFETKILVWKKDTRLKISLCRALAILLTFVTALLALTIVMLLIIPQLIASVKNFASNFNSYIESGIATVNNLLSSAINGGVYKEFVTIRDIRGYLDGLLSSNGDILKQVINTITSSWSQISSVGASVFQFLKNGLIGIFIAIYIIASKELRLAQIRKFRTALFSEKVNKFIDEVVATADKNFGGYIKGKIIDSFIIGVASFVLLTIFNVSEYNMLIAVFIGITNVIPVFGPFIGAIPSGFIVLVTNPSKLILFVVLIVILQQIDGNILGPKILGNSTQVSSFTVLVAITIMGELLGIVGMIIGVPLFATIITIGKRRIDNRLEKKGYPAGTENYIGERLAVEAESVERKTEQTLAYKYEHSSLKPKVDKILSKVFKNRKNKELANDTDDAVLDERELDDKNEAKQTADNENTENIVK